MPKATCTDRQDLCSKGHGKAYLLKGNKREKTKRAGCRKQVRKKQQKEKTKNY